MIGAYRYTNMTIEYFTVLEMCSKNYINATSYMPGGFNPATDDATAWINSASSAAATAGKTLRMPNFNIRVSAQLTIRTNAHYYMPPGGSISRIPSTATTYQVVRIDPCVGSHVVNFVVYGDANSPEKEGMTPGEYGTGVQIKRSVNVTLWNMQVFYAYGDGIGFQISTAEGAAINTSVRVINPFVNYSDRNGIGIVTGDQILVWRGRCNNSVDNPAAGIDIEPFPEDIIGDVTIIGTLCKGNTIQGIQIGMSKWYRSDNERTDNYFGTIFIKDVVVEDSQWGLWVSLNSAAYAPPDFLENKNITGTIIFQNLTLRNLSVEYQHNMNHCNEDTLTYKNINPKYYNSSGVLISGTTLLNETQTKIGSRTPRPILVLT